ALAQKLVGRYPNSSGAWQILARVHLTGGQGAKALESACQALVLDPRSSKLYADVVQALWISRRVDEAYLLAVRTLRADATEATVWSLLGLCYTEKSKGYEAELCCRRAIGLQPRNVGMLSNLASACADNFKFDEAEEYYRQALAVKPSDTNIRSNMLFILSH